jgi:hypothetical protein
MFGRNEWIRRQEIIGLQEIPAHLRRKKQNCCKNHQEHHDTDQVLNGVIRMEWDAVEGLARRFIFIILDFDAVRVTRTHLVQSDQMRHYQTQKHQGQSDHMKREEAIKRCIRNHIVPPQPFRQVRADKWDSTE